MPAESVLSSLRTLPDYPTFERFASVLWQKDNAYHGAAVMVGAGFSRCAGVTGDKSKKLPLWFDLSKVLNKELNSSDSDPLRIAEEYSAYFGRQALNDLLKKEINDSAWEPSDIHSQLLELPWSEVLTTNWDTLLEKASEKTLGRFYNVVNRQEGLSSAHSPRIVKLHGTVNVTNDLTFTQEDYRKYPQTHAAFVNFTRQVFIENELCLIGFSGDDPNFLQWVGWVRDHLSSNARRIYLVGVLKLTAAKRKYLESINIAPIDLEPLVSEYDLDLKHQKATEYFLAALKELEPKKTWEWKPSDLESWKTLEQQLPILQQDRLSYPGWFICPSHLRDELRLFVDQKSIMVLPDSMRPEVLYEIAWRHERTYEATPDWLIQHMLAVCDPSTPNTLTKKQQLEIAVHVLKNSCWVDPDKKEVVEEKTKEIFQKNAQHWPESVEEVAFYDAALALHQLDYEELEIIVNKITPTNSINKLRKASLLGELGLFSKGKVLVSEAHKELLAQFRKDRNSIYALSRLVTVEQIQRTITLNFKKNITYDEKEKFCCLWGQVENLRESVRKRVEDKESKQGTKVLFEPGSYRDNSKTHTDFYTVHPLLVFHGFLFFGIPIRWDCSGFMTNIAQEFSNLDELDRDDFVSLVVRSSNSETDDALAHIFSRLQVASMSQEESDNVIFKCERAIAYWRNVLVKTTENRIDTTLTKLRVFIEVLARLSIRATPEKARELYLFALEMGSQKEMQDVWLNDSIEHLIKYSLKSIPISNHQGLLLKTLQFPLKIELEGQRAYRWPNPVIRNVSTREINTSIDSRIDELINKVRSESSAQVLDRLIPLIENSYLNEDALNRLAEKVWGKSKDIKALPDLGIFKWAFYKLPSSSPEKVEALVRRYLFKAEKGELFNDNRLSDIISAANIKDCQKLPDEKEAVAYFDFLVDWRAPTEIEELRLFRKVEGLEKLVAQALSYSIVPALSKTELDQANFKKLEDFFKSTEACEILISFPYFANALSEKNVIVERLIRNSLLNSDRLMVTQAAIAILKWRELSECDAVKRLISLLISIINYNQAPSMFKLLWTAKKMLSENYLSDNDCLVLREGIPRIFDSMNYDKTIDKNKEIDISFIRAECVKLAIYLLKMDDSNEGNTHLKRVIEEAKSDPLPEVRFAAEQ